MLLPGSPWRTASWGTTGLHRQCLLAPCNSAAMPPTRRFSSSADANPHPSIRLHPSSSRVRNHARCQASAPQHSSNSPTSPSALGMHPASATSCSLSSSRRQAWMLRQGASMHRTLSTRAASTETQQPGGSGQPSRTYSPLHYNIESFCQKIVPTEAEKRQKQAVVEG